MPTKSSNRWWPMLNWPPAAGLIYWPILAKLINRKIARLRCLSVPTEEFEATVISQKIMSAILRTGEQFGVSHIIDVLRGARNKKILERNHDQLSVYGIVQDFSKEDLRHLIGQLVSRKLLVKYGDEFPILGIAQLGQAFLKNREEICLPKPKANGKASQPGAAAEAGYDQELFEQLRRLRKNLADEKGVPPFVVFGDLALRKWRYICRKAPRTLPKSAAWARRS